MSTNSNNYETSKERKEYKKNWYQDNKERQKVLNYRSKGLNYIKNYADIDDIAEYRKALSDREDFIKNS